MPRLKVLGARSDDVFGDLVRVNESLRRDTDGNLVAAGAICRVSTGGKSILVKARGLPHEEGEVIRLDEVLRDRLGVRNGEEREFDISRANSMEQFLWAWSATEPGYRVSARLAVLSVVLGGIGLVLGVVSICLSV